MVRSTLPSACPCSTVDQFAEKLLANADRYADKSVGRRDAVDLGYRVMSHGAIPQALVAKAKAAYGAAIARKLGTVLHMLSSKEVRRNSAETLQMTDEGVAAAVFALGAAARSHWPGLELPAAIAPEQ